MKLYTILAILATISYFLPLIMAGIRRLWQKPVYVLFALFFAWGGLVSLLCDHGLIRNDRFIAGLTRVYNLADGPLILLVMYLVSQHIRIKRAIPFALVLVIGMEVFMLLTAATKPLVETVVTGSVIVINIVFIVWEIMSYIGNVKHTREETNRMFIYSSLLFAYGSSIVLFVFEHIAKVRESDELYMIFFLSVIISQLIATAAYLRHQQVKPLPARQWEENAITYL
jgi:hypothetical protein